MEYTRDSYVGNGSTSIFSITFSFLKNSEIRATINGTLTTSFVFVSSDQIQFLTAPANGAIIDIFRETDDTQLAATLSQGSTIRSSDLNENFNQVINLIQEVDSNNIAGFIEITDELTTTTATANAALPKAGGTMTGAIVLPADPSTSLQAATKQYVDAVGAGAAGLALLKTGGTMTGNLVFAAGQPTATTSTKNIVQLTDSASSTSTTTAATPAAVKVAKDAADAAQSTATTANTTANAALPKSGGTMTGNLEIGTAGSLTFEGATADGFETTLAVVDPTADRTITLPNVTGTVVTTGDTGTVTSTMILDGTIVDGDINASAAIVDTKLATIATAGKVSNSATTATSAYIASTIVARDASGNFSAGSITASLNGIAAFVITNANLTGDVTSVGNATAIAAGVIVDADVNASAAIADTKLATIATAGKVSNSATTAASANTASAIVARDASGNFTAGTITAALTGAASSNVLKAGDTMTGPLVTPAGTVTANGIQVGTGTTYKPGIYSPGVDQVAIATGGTGRIIVDASGNVNIDSNTLYVDAVNNRVGIVNASPSVALDVTGNARAFISGGSPTISANNGTVDNYIGVNATGGLIGTSNNYPVLFLTNNTERARIDSSGRLLVGASSGKIDFQVKTSGGFQAVNANEIALRYNVYYDGSDRYIQATNKASSIVLDGDGLFRFYTTNTASTAADSAITGWVERVRIDDNGEGNFFAATGRTVFGARSATGAGTTDRTITGIHSATSTTATGTISFQVFTNGNTQNTNNSYAGISDVKLKENIIDSSSQWDDLKALQVRNYNFKEETGHETHTQIGLVAQEAELVSPGLVFESPDRDEKGNDLGTVTKSVNYSVLYMKAVKALQEAMERIETLETRLSALEGA